MNDAHAMNRLSEARAGDAIRLSYAYDRALARRGMTGWWQSAVPPVPFVKRVVFWTVVWFLVGLAALLTQAAGISIGAVIGGLIGAGIMVASFAYLQRTRMSRFWDVIGAHWDKAGETEAVFDAQGLVAQDAVSRRELAWPAIDAVRAIQGGTVFRSGLTMLIVPDDALPAGLSGDDFRARIKVWRA